MKSAPKILNSISPNEFNSSGVIVGFSRTLLAGGLLLTLLFNDINLVIPANHLQTLDLQSLKFRCNFFLIFNSTHLLITQVLGIIFMIVIMSGYFMQITCLFHAWISASFFMLRPVLGGGDDINMMLTLLLIPVCLFDERKNHWHTSSKPNNIIQNIFLFIIKLQVAYIYFDSLHDKLRLNEWKNGTVIYYWFTHNFYGVHSVPTPIIEPLLKNTIVLVLIAWGTLLLEALLAAAIVVSFRIKLLLLKCAIIFHFSILLIHGFASFFFAMSAALFLYLYPAKKSFAVNVFSWRGKKLHEVITLLRQNIFFAFYLYIFFVLIIANVLPALTPTYFLFLAFGFIGICILLVKQTNPSLIKNAQL